MALLTVEEFAKTYGLPSKNLYAYFTRTGNIRLVLRKDKLIDTNDPLNKPFIEKKTSFKGEIPLNLVKNTHREREFTEQNSETTRIPVENQHEIKTEQQIEKLKNENLLLQTKISKAKEESIPREHASYLIKNYAIGIKNVWVSATRRFMMEKGIALGLNKEEIIEFEKYIADLVTDSMKSGAEEANKNIRKLAKEFAGIKGRGEKS